MRDERGFTLIELMIVVAIIAILAGVLIPNFVHARAQAATAACEANLRAIAEAAEVYYAANQQYPASTTSVDTTFGGAAGQYLSITPVDPTTGAAGYAFVNNAGSDPPSYTITCPGQHDPATLLKLKGGEGGKASQILYTSGVGLGAK